MNRLLFAIPACLLLFATVARGEDVTQFRGIGGTGSAIAKDLPTKWSDTENILWRTKLPGPGTSSPITLGERVYLTCYSGYGLVPKEGDMKDLRRHILCLNRTTGKVIWDKQFTPVLPESAYRGGNSSRHGYSSSTLATDGKHLYAFFGKSGAYCVDLDGNEIWNTKLGSGTHGWGSSNSPVLYKDLVFINASVESRSLVALNKKTGKEVWRVEKIRSSWNTPVLVDAPGGKMELVLNESSSVIGFNPDTGKELWRVTGFRGYVCPSVIAQDGIVYVVRGGALAIRAGGRGDVTNSHVLWKAGGSSVVPSPVYHKGRIYWAVRGNVHCLDAATGKSVYRERLNPGSGTIYSSLLAADGKLYCVSQSRGTYVLSAGAEFKQLAHNTFRDDDSRTNASPIVSNGQLLLRTDRYLYCIGQKTR